MQSAPPSCHKSVAAGHTMVGRAAMSPQERKDDHRQTSRQTKERVEGVVFYIGDDEAYQCEHFHAFTK